MAIHGRIIGRITRFRCRPNRSVLPTAQESLENHYERHPARGLVILVARVTTRVASEFFHFAITLPEEKTNKNRIRSGLTRTNLANSTVNRLISRAVTRAGGFKFRNGILVGPDRCAA